jgi:transcriptional regulator with XRE-family HTH domain
VKNPVAVQAFGAHLRRLRQARGWSLQDLALEAALSFVTVHRVETAKSAATLDVLLSLARALGVSVKELVDCAEMEQANKTEPA